jgi:hypothetical protein
VKAAAPVLVATVALIAASVTNASASAVTTPSTSAPARCHTSELAAALTPASPGAGQRYALLSLRNRSPHTCRIFGFAGLLLLDSHRRALPTNVVRDLSHAPRAVVLAPGSRTRTLLHWGVIPDASEPQTGACERQPSWVEVTPPDERTHLLIRWRLGVVCEQGRLDATPFGQTVA